MGSKTENVMVMDCNTIANGIMRDITDIDAMERMLSKQLEEGRFETAAVKPQKSLDSVLAEIQRETMVDITLPLQNMFDEMINYVSEAFV